MKLSPCVAVCSLFLIVPGVSLVHAETGYEAWLRYAPLENSAQQKYTSLPTSVVVLGKSEVLTSAHDELVRGVRGMLGGRLRIDRQIREPAIVLGTFAALSNLAPALKLTRQLQADGFWLAARRVNGFRCLVVAANTDRGVLY